MKKEFNSEDERYVNQSLEKSIGNNKKAPHKVKTIRINKETIKDNMKKFAATVGILAMLVGGAQIYDIYADAQKVKTECAFESMQMLREAGQHYVEGQENNIEYGRLNLTEDDIIVIANGLGMEEAKKAAQSIGYKEFDDFLRVRGYNPEEDENAIYKWKADESKEKLQEIEEKEKAK